APRVRWDLLDKVREAATQMGVAAIDDFNTGDNEGAAYFHVTQKQGLRWSSARGFLKPVIDRRDNLEVLSGATVEK
ncbi:GMC family oxidoreductase N-terminal domain-containing protein, partial [Acinetobacter baumannii]